MLPKIYIALDKEFNPFSGWDLSPVSGIAIMSNPDKSEMRNLSYSEEQVKQVLDTPSLLSMQGGINSKNEPNEWEKILNLNKKLIRTDLHGITMREYCRAQIVPQGLIVHNEPKVFTDNDPFRNTWSHIANVCSRDWLILIIDTVSEIAQKVAQEIQTIESKWEGSTLSNISKKLNDTRIEIDEFKQYTTQKKIDKLQKDISNWDLVKTYPYLESSHYTTQHNAGPRYNNRNRRSTQCGSERRRDVFQFLCRIKQRGR